MNTVASGLFLLSADIPDIYLEKISDFFNMSVALCVSLWLSKRNINNYFTVGIRANYEDNSL